VFLAKQKQVDNKFIPTDDGFVFCNVTTHLSNDALDKECLDHIYDEESGDEQGIEVEDDSCDGDRI
jgi:hypothetical protein